MTVARDLLGRVLVCDVGGARVAGRIVEVEAYRGSRDPASHAFRGRTPRNTVMFGEPGHAYVYFTYGMHHCLNFVCEPEGRPAAVLIRALEPLEGLGVLRARRGREDVHHLLRGPGCVAQGLALTREHDGSDLVRGPVFVREALPDAHREAVLRGPRIGIRNGLEHAWRFWFGGDPYVSAKREGEPTRTRRASSALTPLRTHP